MSTGSGRNRHQHTASTHRAKRPVRAVRHRAYARQAVCHEPVGRVHHLAVRRGERDAGHRDKHAQVHLSRGTPKSAQQAWASTAGCHQGRSTATTVYCLSQRELSPWLSTLLPESLLVRSRQAVASRGQFWVGAAVGVPARKRLQALDHRGSHPIDPHHSQEPHPAPGSRRRGRPPAWA